MEEMICSGHAAVNVHPEPFAVGIPKATHHGTLIAYFVAIE